MSSDSDWKHGKIDPEFVYDLYISQLKKMLNYNCFDIICHMDLVKKYGHKSIKPYDREYADIIEKIKQMDITVELNTAGYSHLVGEPYPSPELLGKLSKADIPVTLASDSHKPGDLGRYYDRAFELLNAAGYKQLATFTNRKREMIPIV